MAHLTDRLPPGPPRSLPRGPAARQTKASAFLMRPPLTHPRLASSRHPSWQWQEERICRLIDRPIRRNRFIEVLTFVKSCFSCLVFRRHQLAARLFERNRSDARKLGWLYIFSRSALTTLRHLSIWVFRFQPLCDWHRFLGLLRVTRASLNSASSIIFFISFIVGGFVGGLVSC